MIMFPVRPPVMLYRIWALLTGPEAKAFWLAFFTIAGGVLGLFGGMAVLLWFFRHPEDSELWLTVGFLYVALPLVLLWIVVRIIRVAWTGK